MGVFTSTRERHLTEGLDNKAITGRRGRIVQIAAAVSFR
jgi:hypothetical protein